jgi:hypothetical protein
MCDRHAFQFDVDKAYEDQLVSVLEASPEHPQIVLGFFGLMAEGDRG